MSERNNTCGVELTDLQYHEILDRLKVVMSAIDNNIIQHPVAKIETDIKDQVSLAYDHLYKAYLISSKKSS
tara:strand:- start:103 stop:315 length:213 start_codon:yes stop_codon:yes gene_type:complete